MLVRLSITTALLTAILAAQDTKASEYTVDVGTKVPLSLINTISTKHSAAGLIGVLATRGPDAVLAKGTTVEMVLDRPVSFTENELNFGNYQPPRAAPSSIPPPDAGKTNGMPPRRFPW